MEFVKGHKKIGGRKAGVRNKITLSIREVLEQAFLRSGDLEAFVAWIEKMDEHHLEFYKLYSKLVPLDLQYSTSDIKIVVDKTAEDV